jgi:DNA-binding MarR family transcriptional regulator
MLERLVQQALILRSEDPNDRRMKQLVLTDKGRQVLHESIQARQAWMENLAQQLSAAEQEQVVSALNILISKAGQVESARN